MAQLTDLQLQTALEAVYTGGTDKVNWEGSGELKELIASLIESKQNKGDSLQCVFSGKIEQEGTNPPVLTVYKSLIGNGNSPERDDSQSSVIAGFGDLGFGSEGTYLLSYSVIDGLPKNVFLRPQISGIQITGGTDNWIISLAIFKID